MSAHAGEFLRYGGHLIEDDDVAAVERVLRGEWLTTGPTVKAFEEAFAQTVGARFAVSCSSGTAALHLASLALRLAPGDNVIVPALTFLATANAVRYVGAEVILSDVEADTGLMRGAHLQQALERAPSEKITALYPVHMNGQCADMEAIAGIAAERGLRVVEDACHALGTTYQTASGETVKVGSCCHSDMAIFSFHPVKIIAMGEGGAVTTNDEALYTRLITLRNHGMIRDAAAFENAALAFAPAGSPNPWYYEMPEMGFNYRASDIHCALGLSQIKKLDRFVTKRRELAETYDRLLAPLSPQVRPLDHVSGCTPGWHLYVALIDYDALGLDRATLMNELRERGIGTQVHYLPLHLQPYYRRRYGEQSLPGSERYYARCLSLPLSPGMEPTDVERVVEALGKVLGTS